MEIRNRKLNIDGIRRNSGSARKIFGYAEIHRMRNGAMKNISHRQIIQTGKKKASNFQFFTALAGSRRQKNKFGCGGTIFNFQSIFNVLIYKCFKITKLKIKNSAKASFNRNILKKSVALATIFAVITIAYFQNANNARSATYTWNQTSWATTPPASSGACTAAGGTWTGTECVATHDNNQSSWATYESKDANISAGTELTLALANDSSVQTITAHFNTGTTSQTTVANDSVQLSSIGVFGSGADGAITVTGSQNINTTNSNGRSCADDGDGVTYNVTALGSNTATLSASPSTGCLAANDVVLLLNLQGDGTDVTNVGNYEFMTVQSVSTNTVTFTGNKTEYYGDGASDDTNIGTATTNQRVILQRIPQYTNVTIQSGGSLTADAWNGTKGGALAFYANGTVTVESGGSMTMNAKGYRGGTGGICGMSLQQGESYNKLGTNSDLNNLGGGSGGFLDCMEGDGNAGGGGYGTAGAGGGSGTGGSVYGSSSLTQLFMGSGGGGVNNTGAAGGGIIYLNAGTILLSNTISSNGGADVDDGGGAGGSVYFKGNTLTLGTNNATATGGSGYAGGGNGRIYLKSNSISGTTSPTYASSSLPTTYYSSGTFTSGPIDTGQPNAGWGNLTLGTSGTSGTETIAVKVRTCDDSACSSAGTVDESSTKAWGFCDVLSSGTDINDDTTCATNGDRYVQYQAALAGDTSVTPSLNDVTVAYSYYPTNQTLISSAFNSTDSANALVNIIWTRTVLTGTAVKFQIQTAPDSAGSPGTWSGWMGTDGTDATYFETYTGNTIPADLSDSNNDQWFQYKVFLISTGQNTPTLSDVTLSYVVNATPTITNVTAAQNLSTGTVTVNYDTDDDDNSQHNIYFSADVGATLADNPLDSSATTISLSGNYGNLPSGTITVQIDSEMMTCSRSGATLSSCSARGTVNNTRATAHTQGAVVWYVASNASNLSGNVGINQSSTKVDIGTGHSGTWNIKNDMGELYLNNSVKIRVSANDGQLANMAGTGDSATFTLDTKNPTGFAISSIDHTQNQVVITAATEDSNYEMYIGNASGTLFDAGNITSPLLNQASSYPNTYTYSSMTSDPATVYVGVKDAKGNTAYTQMTTPAKPTNPVYYDTSSSSQGVYQEFLAWDVVSAAQDGEGFAAYNIYRKIDDGSYSLLATVTDRTTNYYLDKIFGTDTESDPSFDVNNPSTYTYKITTTDTAGNISVYSTEISDIPNGTGGSDTTAPTISNVVVSNINTTSATVTWTTDELASSYVGYSADTAYLPEIGLASMVTSHSIALTGLDSDTTYNIRVKSYDAIGNLGQNDKDSPGSNNVLDFTFATLAGPEISSVTVDSNNTNATVSWVTTTDSDTYIVYSDMVTSGALIASEEIGAPDLVGGGPNFNHSHNITTFDSLPLVSGDTYYFYVKSTDASDVTAIDNNGGNFYSFSTTQDDDAPVISGVSAAVRNNTQAVIAWTTDEGANSTVDYGTVSGT